MDSINLSNFKKYSLFLNKLSLNKLEESMIIIIYILGISNPLSSKKNKSMQPITECLMDLTSINPSPAAVYGQYLQLFPTP
jgi:hypothetical protein